MGKKNHQAVGVAVIAFAVAILGIGGFLGVKFIIDENHKKDIEMAADCARSFDMGGRTRTVVGFQTYDWDVVANNRRQKREECASKYHVTHQEIIDKIGNDNYQPSK